MVVFHPFPFPADAFLEADVFVGTGAGRFFGYQVAAGLAVVQLQTDLVSPVIRFAVGARLVPLCLAAVRDAAIARVPIDEVNRGAPLHVNIHFVIVDNFHFPTGVIAEIVGVRCAAVRVGVVGHGVLDVLRSELAPVVVPTHALAQFEVPGPAVRRDAPLGGEHGLVGAVKPAGIHHPLCRHSIVQYTGAGDFAVQHRLQRWRVGYQDEAIRDQLTLGLRGEGGPGRGLEHRSTLRGCGGQSRALRHWGVGCAGLRRRLGGGSRLSLRLFLLAGGRCRRLFCCASATHDDRGSRQRDRQHYRRISQKPSIRHRGPPKWF